MIELLLLLIAVLLLGLATFGVPGWGRFSFLAGGLFFWALSVLWPHLSLGASLH